MGELGVCPEMLQVVIGAYLWQEDVNENIHKVHSHPLVVAQTYHIHRLFAKALAAHVAH